MLNNVFVFLNNVCGSDCPTDGTNHLCEECYKITKFCDDCSLHLKNVLDMSNIKYWVLIILTIVICIGFGYLIGSLERPIKDI